MLRTFFNLIYTVLIALVCLVPVWLYLGARNVLDPQSFLGEFFVFGVGVWLLGGMQIILALIGLIVGYFVWGRS